MALQRTDNWRTQASVTLRNRLTPTTRLATVGSGGSAAPGRRCSTAAGALRSIGSMDEARGEWPSPDDAAAFPAVLRRRLRLVNRRRVALLVSQADGMVGGTGASHRVARAPLLSPEVLRELATVPEVGARILQAVIARLETDPARTRRSPATDTGYPRSATASSRPPGTRRAFAAPTDGSPEERAPAAWPGSTHHRPGHGRRRLPPRQGTRTRPWDARRRG